MMFRMNQLINKIFSDDKFTSLFYGEYPMIKRIIPLCKCRANPPLFYRKKIGDIVLLNPTSVCLVLTPNSKFETDSINFYNGDVLVIYSDGVVEAANDKFEFYGDDKLRQIVFG